MNAAIDIGRERRVRTLAIAAIALGALMLLALIIARRGKIAPGLLQAPVARIPNLPLDRVRVQVVPKMRDVVGTVQSRTEVQAASRVAATVREVRVRAGDRVRAGEVLVALDSADLEAALREAEQSAAAADARLDLAARDRARFSALIKRESVTQREYEAAESGWRASAAQAAAASAQVAVARAALQYTVVKSPVAGVIAERLVEPGDLAMPGKPLVTLYDPATLRVELRVPDELTPKITLGTALDIRIDAARRDVRSAVNEIVPASDPASRTFLVRAPLPASPELRPGMFARATLAVGEEKVLTVARGAIETVGQLETVRVVEDGAVRMREITTGRAYRNRIEVLSGLNAGDRVLMQNGDGQAHE